MMLHNKRGSTMVTAIILLMFILMMGAVLIQWGLLNVQTTVNIRTDTQAYYTAKSVLDAAIDKLVADNNTRKAMDADLKALAQGASLTAQPITLPSDTLPGDVTVKIQCLKTEYTDPANCYGKQTLKMTVDAENKEQNTATEDRTQRASISREFIITRTPPGSGGIIGYSGTERQSYSLNGGTSIKGDFYAINATGFHATGAGITIEGNLYIDATESIEVTDTAVSGTVLLRALSGITVVQNEISTVYAQSGTSNYRMHADNGSWTVTVPGGTNAAEGTVWGSLPTWKQDPAQVSTAMQALDAQVSAGYAVREYRGEGGKVYDEIPDVIEESGKITAEVSELKNFTVKTGGGTIDLYFEKVLMTGDVTLTIEGDGEVNIYVNGSGFDITPGFQIMRSSGDANVNFIGEAASGTRMTILTMNVENQKYNVLSVYGMVQTSSEETKQYTLNGSLYGTVLQLNNCNIDTTNTSFGSVLQGGSGGGSETVITCEKGKYVR